jgi:hypothetical protein
VVCAVSCSRGGAKPGAGKTGAARTDTLFEATGLDTVRIDEATVPDAIKALGVTEAEARTFNGGLVELRKPPLFVLSFLPPAEGQGPARLYAIRAVLWDPPYTIKTSKGIGFLDSIERMHELYGEPDTVWVTQRNRIHYYAQQGVIFKTNHPVDIAPKIYADARAALGKTPDEGPSAHVVTTIMVVRPFTVTKGAETAMVRQQVVSTRPETDLRVPEF